MPDHRLWSYGRSSTQMRLVAEIQLIKTRAESQMVTQSTVCIIRENENLSGLLKDCSKPSLVSERCIKRREVFPTSECSKILLSSDQRDPCKKQSVSLRTCSTKALALKFKGHSCVPDFRVASEGVGGGTELNWQMFSMKEMRHVHGQLTQLQSPHSVPPRLLALCRISRIT